MSKNRTRALRRFRDRINKGKGMGSDELFKPEKKWKLMYLRKTKLVRSRQLGFDYPVKSQRQLLDSELPIEG